MNDIEKRAVECLAEAYRQKGQPGLASLIIEREGRANSVWGDVALNAIIAAFTPPEGYVLVPVEPTEKMLAEGYGWVDGPDLREAYIDMLAARPEISP